MSPLNRNHAIARSFATRPVPTMLALLGTVVVVAAAIFSIVEGVRYVDGVWWALVTATTVGYGDIAPKTTGMRLVAVTVMFTGILTAAVVTASFAANIVASRLQAVNETQAIDDDFDYVIERVQQLKQRYLEDESGDDRVVAAAKRVIDAHFSGSSDLRRHVEELEEAIEYQHQTDA